MITCADFRVFYTCHAYFLQISFNRSVREVCQTSKKYEVWRRAGIRICPLFYSRCCRHAYSLRLVAKGMRTILNSLKTSLRILSREIWTLQKEQANRHSPSRQTRHGQWAWLPHGTEEPPGAPLPLQVGMQVATP